jgi:transcriptional regulator with XRE-family HTH domain
MWSAEMAVKELRLERNWSQEKLADLSGLSLRTVQRMEGSNKAGYESLRALASAFKIDVSALQLELAMDKASSGWKRRPAWVRAVFFGSGAIRMDRRQHRILEKIAVLAGMAFVLIGIFGTNGTIVPESAKISFLLFASLSFFCAYLMSLLIRVGDRYAVWQWVDPNPD